jgi:hypothetical protein
MTEQERQAVKAKLIEFGFRGADEPGDPTTDIHDAGALHDRIQAKLPRMCSCYRGCLLSVYHGLARL